MRLPLFYAMGLILASLLIQAAATPLPAEAPDAKWKRAPSPYESAFAYPSLARATSVGGQATLKCKINDVGAPAHCAVHSETPEGAGFGKALMSLRSKMRFEAPGPGEDPWVLITVNFDPKQGLLIP